MKLPPSQKLILKYAKRPISTSGLTVALKLDRSTVKYHIRALRAAGLLKIGKYGEGTTKPVPMYVVGNGADAEKPKPKTKAELNRSWRERNPHVTMYAQATPWDALMRKQ